MAALTTPIDMSTKTSGVVLPKDVSSEIIAKARQASAVMSLAAPIALPGPGLTIPVITGDPEASWVGETEAAPIGKSTMTSKFMKSYKLSLIELFSKEFTRDLPTLYDELVARLPGAMGKKLDETVFCGTAPGSGFDVLSDVTQTVKITDTAAGKTYDAFLDADELVGEADGAVSAYVLCSKGRTAVLKCKDANSRPYFLGSPMDGTSTMSILDKPVTLTERVRKAGTKDESVPEQLGIAGDWSGARYGIVDNVTVTPSTEATVVDADGNVISLYQRQMVAMMVSFEVGFIVRDKSQFVRLVGDVPTA